MGSTLLTGLVTCPSRSFNPTYNPTTSLPSTYLFGCAPGYVCSPERSNCNFEGNLPADTYRCSPDKCVLAKPLPDIGYFINRNLSGQCASYDPLLGYFHLNPAAWGLGYAVFDIYGQPTCVTSAPSQTTVSSRNTHRDFVERQAIFLPPECYPVVDGCQLIVQSTGLNATKLCAENGAFLQALASVTQCLLSHRGVGDRSVATLIPLADDYCRSVVTGSLSSEASVQRTSALATPSTPVQTRTASATAPVVASLGTSSVGKPLMLVSMVLLLIAIVMLQR